MTVAAGLQACDVRYEVDASRTRRDASAALVLTWPDAILLPRSHSVHAVTCHGTAAQRTRG